MDLAGGGGGRVRRTDGLTDRRLDRQADRHPLFAAALVMGRGLVLQLASLALRLGRVFVVLRVKKEKEKFQTGVLRTFMLATASWKGRRFRSALQCHVVPKVFHPNNRTLSAEGHAEEETNKIRLGLQTIT